MKQICLILGAIFIFVGSIITINEKVQAANYPGFRKSRPISGQVLQASTSNAQCTNISIYTVSGSTWTKITNFQNLRPGQTVRIAAAGAASSGIFDMARFRVNTQPTAWTQTTDVNPYGEYYISYTFPTNTNSLTFDIEAQIHHVTDGWR